LITAIVLQSLVFSRMTAYAGVGAGVAGVGAVVLEHIPGPDVLITIAIAWYFAAIALLLVWVILTGRRLYFLGRQHPTNVDEVV
jgi:hypothetical protein